MTSTHLFSLCLYPTSLYPWRGVKSLSWDRHFLFNTSIRVPSILSSSSFTSVQLLSCDPMDCDMTGFPVHHQLLSLLKLMSIELWWHPTISSSVVPFSSCLQSLPVSGSFQMSHFFTAGAPRIGVSASASVLPMNIPDWFPLGLTGWISLHSKGLSRVFSNTAVQKHHFFGAQLSLWSNPHIHTWPLEKP